MAGNAGRKTFFEELKLKDKYSELAPKYFKVLEEFLDSDDKKDRQWAADQLGKAFHRMVPQDMDATSGGEPFSLIINRYGGEPNNNESA